MRAAHRALVPDLNGGHGLALETNGIIDAFGGPPMGLAVTEVHRDQQGEPDRGPEPTDSQEQNGSDHAASLRSYGKESSE